MRYYYWLLKTNPYHEHGSFPDAKGQWHKASVIDDRDNKLLNDVLLNAITELVDNDMLSFMKHNKSLTKEDIDRAFLSNGYREVDFEKIKAMI